MRKGFTLATVAIAIAAAVAAGGLSITAFAGGTLYVSHSGIAGASDTNCNTAAYSSVQTAINAATNGSQVYLCGTVPYLESVVIQNKQVNLTGDPGAALKAPANAAAPTTFFSSQNLQTPNSIVTVIGNVNVQINGLIIEGPFENTSCAGDDFGVLQIKGGQLQMNNDKVLNIEAADQEGLGGCQYGVGVQIGRYYWPVVTGTGNDGFSDGYNIVNFTGNAQIQNTAVSGYQKNGITADGQVSQIQVQATTVDGGGLNAMIGRNGIQIGRGATGQVHNDSVNNNEYTGPGSFASATAVLVFGGCQQTSGGGPLSVGVQVHDNTLKNNDSGVVFSNFDPTCATAPSQQTNGQTHDNTVSKGDGETNHSPYTDENGNNYTGYQVGVADTGNNDQVHDNHMTGTVIDGIDTAYGPQTTPGGNFLAPVDIQTYPPINTQVHDNTLDGARTNPPY